MAGGDSGEPSLVGEAGPEAACDPLGRCRACATANFSPDRGMTNVGCGLNDNDVNCVFINISNPRCDGSYEYYDGSCVCLNSRCGDVCPFYCMR